VKKTEYGWTTWYLRSSVLGGQVIAEIDGNNVWQRGYVYAGSSVMAVQQGGVFWMHEDPITKSKRTTDANGNVVSAIELDPWGADTNRSSSAAFQPRKYTSYDRDGNGSDEAMFRRYNRKNSRFDQPDPYDGSYSLAYPQSFNRYAYVGNDPVNFADPTGLDDLPPDPWDPSDIIKTDVWAPHWPRGGIGGGIHGPLLDVDDGKDGGGPQKPDSFQKALDNAIAKSKAILQGDSDCSKFFGSNAVAALEALAKKLTLANNFKQGITTNTGISQSYDSTIVVNGPNNLVAYRLPTSAEVYRNGPFFMSPGAKPIGGYPAGSAGAQITSILHELAHDIITDPKKYTALIRNDGTDPSLSNQNTRTILKHCAKEIFNAAK
jgi:RHS repeat-associated protein